MNTRQFPPDFLWGSATSPYQIEGAWDEDDNLEWDMGWGQRFGLIHVDYQALKRTVKDSGWWHRDWIQGKEK
jgi:beta-glucosidase/6-phospho-beta-glucosidase/beta-galactosidase